MRLICNFDFEGELVLPANYNQILQGFIYNNLTNEVLRTFIHEIGFKKGKRKYKMFTFSRLLGRFQYIRADKTIKFHPPIQLHISSLIDDLVNDITTTFFKSNDLFLKDKQINLVSVNVKSPDFKSRQVKIDMLSPIVVYSTLTVNGQKKTIYYSPLDPLFSRHVKNNALRKYSALYGKIPDDEEFEIYYRENTEPKPIITTYHNTIVKGSLGSFILKGNPELIKFTYFTGLGSKNSQGFGCFEIRN